jgi:hypothetical protein
MKFRGKVDVLPEEGISLTLDSESAAQAFYQECQKFQTKARIDGRTVVLIIQKPVTKIA